MRGLAGVMREDFLPAWLQQPNGAFDGRTPAAVIARGEHDRIERMIYYLASGMPT